MPIRVLLADDSPCTLSAVRRVLQEEPRITIIGEALVCSGIMQMIGDFKPEVLLFDLHMPEKRNFTPAFVKSQFVLVSLALAMSVANDEGAKALAESYGVALLDKMNLYTDMIPAILRCRSKNRVFDFRPQEPLNLKRRGTEPSWADGLGLEVSERVRQLLRQLKKSSDRLFTVEKK